MTNRTLVLIGAAHVHTPDHVRVAEEEGWHIAAVFDRDTARRQAWSDRLKARPLDSLHQLGDSGAAAALVCSETCHHEADILAALDLGLPVFVEKPLTADAEAARRVAEAARRAGVILDTAFFLRTNGPLAEARERVRAGAIGPVMEARMRFSHDGGLADWLDLTGWMTQPDLACYGGFADEGVHVIDWLVWTLGPVAAGHAVRGHALGFPVDDHGAAVLRLESGATAVVEAGWTDTAMRLELDLVGCDGGISLRDGRLRQWQRGAAEDAWTATLSPLDAGEGVRPFLRAVAAGAACGLVPPAEAVAVSAVLDRLHGR